MSTEPDDADRAEDRAEPGVGSAPITVLHVDDDPDFCDLAAEFLEREDPRIEVVTASGAEAGLACLGGDDVECVVSDFDMPGVDGIEFLKRVRETRQDLPFILFTGKGSEDIAAEAVSAGVSDYLQKGGRDRYVLLANRIVNLVSQARNRAAVARIQERFRMLVEESTDVILVVGPDATIDYASPAAESILGQSPAELRGTSGFDPVHTEDIDRVMEQFGALAAEPGARQQVEFRYERPDGSVIWVEARGRNLLEDPAVEGIVVYTRDVTERRKRAERFRAVFEQAAEAMVVADDDGRFVAVNEEACELFGREREDLLGATIEDVVDPEPDIPPAWAYPQSDELSRDDVPIVLPGGTVRNVEFAARADILEDEHLSILRDVTDPQT